MHLVGRILGWLGLVLAGLLLVLLVLAWIGIRIPLARLAPAIEPVLESTLGAELSFAAESFFELSLRPAVAITDLAIDGPDIDLKVRRLEGDMRLAPLLQKRLALGQITIKGARLDYTRRIGRPAGGGDNRSAAGAESWLQSLTIDEIALDDVGAVITDADTGDAWRFSITDLDLEMPDPGELHAELAGSYQDTPLEVKVDSTRDASGGWALERLLVTGPASRLYLRSHLQFAPLRGDGRLEFELTSEEDLRQWIGERAAPLAPLRLAADARFSGDKGEIEIGRLLFGPVAFEGDAALDLSGDRPSARLVLHSAGFDAASLLLENAPPLSAQIPANAEPVPESPPARERSDAQSESAPALAELITPFLEAIDVDLAVTIDRIDGLEMSVADLSIRTRLEAGRLELPVSVVLADVPFEGQLGIEIQGSDVVFSCRLDAPPSDIGGLADAFLQANIVRGRHGGLDIAMNARGKTLRELVAGFEISGRLRDSALSYGDRPVAFELEQMDFSAGMLKAAQATARGVLLGQPFAASMITVPLVQVLRGEGWRSRLEIDATGTRIVLDGSLDQGAAGIDFELQSNNRDVLRDWLGIELSRPVPVAVKGRVRRESGQLHFVIDPLRLGRSSVSVDAYTSGPNADYKVRATVRGSEIDLEEWAEVLGSAEDHTAVAASPGRGVRLDIPILPSDYQILDADFDLAIDDLSYGDLHADTLRLVGRSRDGRIRGGDLTARTPYGDFDGELSIDLASSRPEIELQAEAAPIRLGSLLADLGVVNEALMEADSASIRFAIAGRTANEILKSIDTEFLLRNGAWDLLPDIGLVARFDRARFVAHGEDPVRIEIAGNLEGQPMRLNIDMTSLARLADQEDASLEIAAALGELRFETALAGSLPLGSGSSSINVNMQSPGLDELNELLGLDLPPWGPIALSGRLVHENGHYSMPDARVAVGDTELFGNMMLLVRERPQLTLAFEAPLVQLDDFRSPEWSAGRKNDGPRSAPSPVESGEPVPDSVNPHSPLLSQQLFERLDAVFTLDVTEVRSGADLLGAGRVEASLKNDIFELTRLGLELPGGYTEARGRMQWRDAEHLDTHVELDVAKLDYGVLARRLDPDSTMKGIFSLFARLDAEYVASDGLMSGASGGLVFGVWPEDFKSGIFDLWAIGLANALLPKLGSEDVSTVNCLVGGFNLEDGRLDERILFADTSRIQVSGEMNADFVSRELDAYMVPKAKRAQIFSFAAPVKVDGEFDDYDIGFRTRDLVAAIFRFIASPVVAPIRWLTEDPVPRDGVVACQQAWQTNIGADTVDDAPAGSR
jgi:uncharacterized protein involved in outer membrane biogenesis